MDGHNVYYDDVAAEPAFNLNLSSVLFASAADAASSDDFASSSSMAENTYTLRYESAGTENAEISADGTLTNFGNCEVWIESTEDRITTAKMATTALPDAGICRRHGIHSHSQPAMLSAFPLLAQLRLLMWVK